VHRTRQAGPSEKRTWQADPSEKRTWQRIPPKRFWGSFYRNL